MLGQAGYRKSYASNYVIVRPDYLTLKARLAFIGRVMACARQLDMLMNDDQAMRHFVEGFLQVDYYAFA